MGMSARERAFNNRVVNPVMIALITHGLGPPTYAVVETTGRKTGAGGWCRSPAGLTATHSG